MSADSINSHLQLSLTLSTISSFQLSLSFSIQLVVGVDDGNNNDDDDDDYNNKETRLQIGSGEALTNLYEDHNQANEIDIGGRENDQDDIEIGDTDPSQTIGDAKSQNKSLIEGERRPKLKVRPRAEAKDEEEAKRKSQSGDGRQSLDSLHQRAIEAPALHSHYLGRVRENERLVEMMPKLRLLNQAEVCDIELIQDGAKWRAPSISNDAKLQEQEHQEEIPFIVSWIDRVSGEATLEASSEQLMNCERRRNYTFKMRAVGCNGLRSNE